MQLRSFLRRARLWKRWESTKVTTSAQTIQEQSTFVSTGQHVIDQQHAQPSQRQGIGEALRSSQASVVPMLRLPQARSLLPSRPSNTDLLYSMNTVSMDPTFSIPEDHVYPVISDNRSSHPDHMSSASLSNPMAVVIKNEEGVFRHIHVRFDDDESGSRARVQCIMHDTGSACSLTFERKLRALGMNFQRFNEQSPGPYMRAVNGGIFRAIGWRDVEFSYYDIKHQTHWVRLYVLADQEREPAFDMLFGRDLLSTVGALTWDLDVIGINVIT